MTSSPSKRKVKPVAAGCVVNAEDTPIVAISFICFAAFIIYGASNAALGAAVPALARALGKSESRIGFIFIFRGAGFLTGTLGSAALMTHENLPLSKEIITCLSSITLGIATYLMSCTSNYKLVLGLSIIQGLGFGGVDCISNCLFPELWGTRIQPWMQALHLCFGIGAMIGPSFVGYMGYVSTYRVLGVSAFFPLVGLLVYRFFATAATTLKTETAVTGSTINENSAYKYVSTSITEDDDTGLDTSTYAPFSAAERSEHGGVALSTLSHRNHTTSDAHGAANDSNNSLSSLDTAETEKSSVSDSPEVSHPVTLTLRILILVFYFIYAGYEAGYAGWIPVYVLAEDITTNDSQAAYVSATFWATMTIGRMLAVFTAMFFSATTMLRFHLLFTALCCTMFMFVEQVGTFQYALAVSALLGLAMSATYALVMTIVIDYGYTM